MDISEDDDNSLSNKQGNKLVDNSLNEILQAKTASNSDHSVTKREIDEEDSNSEDSIDDNTNENDIKNGLNLTVTDYQLSKNFSLCYDCG